MPSTCAWDLLFETVCYLQNNCQTRRRNADLLMKLFEGPRLVGGSDWWVEMLVGGSGTRLISNLVRSTYQIFEIFFLQLKRLFEYNLLV